MRKATGFSSAAERKRNKAIFALRKKLGKHFSLPSESDLRFIQEELGRHPDNVIAVTRYCRYGYPQGFISFPIVRGNPFPAIFWLNCPYLVKKCSIMESGNIHKNLERKIKSNRKIKNEFYESLVLLSEVRHLLAGYVKYEFNDDFYDLGIGGASKRENIKCLHAFFACYLGGIKSPVSKELISGQKELECDIPCRENRN